MCIYKIIQTTFSKLKIDFLISGYLDRTISLSKFWTSLCNSYRYSTISSTQLQRPFEWSQDEELKQNDIIWMWHVQFLFNLISLSIWEYDLLHYSLYKSKEDAFTNSCNFRKKILSIIHILVFVDVIINHRYFNICLQINSRYLAGHVRLPLTLFNFSAWYLSMILSTLCCKSPTQYNFYIPHYFLSQNYILEIDIEADDLCNEVYSWWKIQIIAILKANLVHITNFDTWANGILKRLI